MSERIGRPPIGDGVLFDASGLGEARLGPEPLPQMLDDVCIGHVPIISASAIIATTDLSEAQRYPVATMPPMNVGDRIKQARKERGMTQAELGEAIGLKQPTIAEMEAGKLKNWPQHASKIMRALDKPRSYFEPDYEEPSLAKIGKAAGLTPPQLPEPSLVVEKISQWVPLVGEVRAGTWTEIREEPVVEDEIPVHLPEYQRASLFAVRVAGRSMDLKYQEGSIVIALPVIEAGLRVGDDVIVRRHRNGLAETTLKEVGLGDDGTYTLLPRSSDLSFEPIALPRARDAQEGVEIIGVVIYSISPSRQGRGPLVILDD